MSKENFGRCKNKDCEIPIYGVEDKAEYCSVCAEKRGIPPSQWYPARLMQKNKDTRTNQYSDTDLKTVNYVFGATTIDIAEYLLKQNKYLMTDEQLLNLFKRQLILSKEALRKFRPADGD